MFSSSSSFYTIILIMKLNLANKIMAATLHKKYQNNGQTNTTLQQLDKTLYRTAVSLCKRRT